MTPHKAPPAFLSTSSITASTPPLNIFTTPIDVFFPLRNTSPHKLMRLNKIPYEDFYAYVANRLPEDAAKEILAFTNCHPYYTQQLAYHVWDMLHYENVTENLLEETIERLVNLHDLDFERLWMSLTRQERRIMQTLSEGNGNTLLRDHSTPTSTTFSALKKLIQKGYVIRTTSYEIEDPFFDRWIKRLNS